MRRRRNGPYHRDFKWYASLSAYNVGAVIFEATPCAYCGMPAETDDHVIPWSFYASVNDCVILSAYRWALVPACYECNCIAGDKVFETISQKRRYIQERLRCRYRKILSIPPWSEEDLADLSPLLAQYVRHGLKLRAIISQRITYRSPLARHAERLLPRNDHGNGTAQNTVEPHSTPAESWRDSERSRENDGPRTTCETCGTRIHPKRATARFCSDKCRYAAWDKLHPRMR